MHIRKLLPALLLGASLLVVSQTPAQAKKFHYKTPKFKKAKGHRVKPFQHHARTVKAVKH
jgi:hypothetical protein